MAAEIFAGTDILLNKRITCEYAGKPRDGKVVKATPTTLTIEYAIPDSDKPQYRSLTIAGITGMKVEGHGL